MRRCICAQAISIALTVCTVTPGIPWCVPAPVTFAANDIRTECYPVTHPQGLAVVINFKTVFRNFLDNSNTFMSLNKRKWCFKSRFCAGILFYLAFKRMFVCTADSALDRKSVV